MMKFNLWVLSQGLQRDLRWGKRGEVLGGKLYGKLTIFKYFQDMCMIYTSNFGFRDPINFPRYKLWISSTRRIPSQLGFAKSRHQWWTMKKMRVWKHLAGLVPPLGCFSSVKLTWPTWEEKTCSYINRERHILCRYSFFYIYCRYRYIYI